MNFSNLFAGVSSSDRRRLRSSRTSQKARRVGVEPLERRELLAATAFISEVHPAGSGNGTYAADWFEVTNPGPAALDITGWRMDDSSNLFASSVPLRGPASIPAGKSVVFLDNSTAGVTDESVIAAFSSAWFGTPSLPAGVLVGAYGGTGVGMGAGGDAVNLFNASGTRITGIGFGAASPAAATFDNVAGLGSATLPLPIVTTLSSAGVNGGFLSADGRETGSPGRTITGVDLSTYVRVGRYDLPEPTRTAAPPDSLLAQEASAVSYDWDTDTLFVVGDGSTSIVQVSTTGQLIDSMTLASSGSPQGTEFFDIEGLAYVGGGRFVMVEERDRQLVLFSYAPATTLTRSATQTVALGTFLADDGIEGVSFDPATGGFIAVKEKQPQGIFQTDVDFAAGTATNGSPTTVNSINLFDPALAGLLDFADAFALSNLPTLNGSADSGNLLVLSQESGRIVHVDRSGNILSSLTIASDPGSPFDVPGQQHEGIAMDASGFLYVVSENGGGDVDHPQLWVYAPATVPNQAPTALVLNNAVAALAENTATATRVKVADVTVTDDGLGTNALSVTGPDAAFFEADASGLYVKAGTVLDYETKTSYSVTVVVDDANVGGTPDATAAYALSITDVVDEGAAGPSLAITEVAPWSSGSPVGADWFEVTNTGDTAVDITGWKMDDGSNSFAAAVALNGITTIAPGESVIFLETSDLAAKSELFRSTWFGGNAPAGLQIGSYGGGSVGLSTTADAVNLFDSLGVPQAGVTFGASAVAPLATFNNAAGLDGVAISELSVIGVNGAFAAANDQNQIGSPGTIGRLFVSEVAPWASGNSPVGADWFEVTNTTARPIDLTGWKVDDSSAAFAAAVALNGITSIAPGESVIFIETNDLAGKAALFLSTWFGAHPPTHLQIGNYTGGSIGLGTGGDAVNLFDAAGTLRARVIFGASPAGPSFATFTNAAALNNATIAQLSADGIDGAFVAVNDANEVGSPGTIDNDAPVAVPDLVTTAEDSAVSFNVLSNDADSDGDALSIAGFTGVAHGVLVSHGNGTFTYTPAPDFNGVDAFTYAITDGNGRTATAAVEVSVGAVNDAPVLSVPGPQTAPEDVAVVIAGIAVADVDLDEGTGLMRVTLSVSSGTLTIADAVAGGLTGGEITGNGTSLVILEGSIAALNATIAAGVRYLGSLNFNGTDALTIVADDLGATGAGGAATDSKTVPIRVLSPAEQIDGLSATVKTLYAQAALDQNQANALLKKLEHARTALAEGKPKVACAAIRGFVDNVESFVATAVLTPALADPLLSAAESLLLGLQAGAERQPESIVDVQITSPVERPCRQPNPHSHAI